MKKCQQKPNCGNDASFRFTWPGRDESFICLEHSIKLAHVASAMGLRLQIIPILPDAIEEDVL